MGTFRDLKGQRFGKLTVIKLFYLKTPRGGMQWECFCDCGKSTVVASGHLVSGHTQSCGCLLDKARKEYFKASHGKSDSRIYSIYSGIKTRCYTPSCEKFPIYGGRGIIMCDRWRESFENFYEDMGEPLDGYEIERINVNGNYEPSNCKWITHGAQQRNTRNNVRITIFGRNACLTEICELLGIHNKMVYERIRNDWVIACALFIPSLQKESNERKKIISDFAKRKRELNSLKY